MNTVSIHQRRRSRKAQRWHIPSYAELRLARRFGLPPATAHAVAELAGLYTGGGPPVKNHNNNVVPFPRDRRAVLTGSHHHVTPFDELTAVMVMARDARGELDPSVLAALLAGVGLELPR